MAFIIFITVTDEVSNKFDQELNGFIKVLT